MIPLLLAPIISMLAEKGMGAISSLIEGGADKAISLVAEKTGIDLTKVEKLTPEQEKALRDFDLEMRKLDLAEQQALLNDVASARNMQVSALAQDDLFSKRFVYYLAVAWSIFAFVYILGITFYPIPDQSMPFANTILGFLLGTVIATILNFFFGSSLGSKSKTDLLTAKNPGL